jgi:diguanylate cyclase (GGDEF)-like protein
MTTATHRTACRHEHVVDFYVTEDALAASVVRFMAPALNGEDAVILVATREHREAFEAGFAAAGVDVLGAARAGRYLAVDATALLASLMAGGMPDRTRFREAVGALLDAASRGGREVRIYGELVALLLERGDISSTLCIEDLWNELALERHFQLLCGYPLDVLGSAPARFARICDRHTAVAPSASSRLLADIHEQHRLVASLRHEEVALRGELARLRSEQALLVELAYLDPLTELPNRRAFDERLRREWTRAARRASDSYVVVADLDDFKELNDTLGHAAGDLVLCRFADTLRRAARRTDLVARIGGDEFAVVLAGCDEQVVHAFAKRVHEAVARWQPGAEALGVSLGHASLRHSSSPAVAIDRADLAMLALKRARRRRRTARV